MELHGSSAALLIVRNPFSFSSLHLSVAKIVTEVEYFKAHGPNCYQIVIKEATEACFVLQVLVNF